MAKKTQSVLEAFVSTTQGHAAATVSVVYLILAILLGKGYTHFFSAAIKLAVLVYTINCMVGGSCRTLGWMHVGLLALYCAADLACICCNRAHGPSAGGSGHGWSLSRILGGANSTSLPNYAEAREKLGKA